tara:strand:+ start:8540 stop:9010 length:471 start_codon:yes stop_codon:yes gene_type:complete
MATTNNTLDDSRKTVLSNQERAQGFTHKWTVKYTDVNDGSGSSDDIVVALGDTPTDFVITKVLVNVTTAFAGTGGFAIEVGTDGDDNNFIESTSVAAVGPIIAALGAVPKTFLGTYAAASDALTATFTNSSSGSPSALTAGECDIYLCMIDANNIG